MDRNPSIFMKLTQPQGLNRTSGLQHSPPRHFQPPIHLMFAPLPESLPFSLSTCDPSLRGTLRAGQFPRFRLPPRSALEPPTPSTSAKRREHPLSPPRPGAAPEDDSTAVRVHLPPPPLPHSASRCPLPLPLCSASWFSSEPTRPASFSASSSHQVSPTPLQAISPKPLAAH